MGDRHIKDLIEELFFLIPNKFFDSKEFHEDCKNSPFGNYWRLFLIFQESNTSFLACKNNIDKARDAMKLLCEKTYEGGVNSLYELVLMTIRSYCIHNKTKLDLSKLRQHMLYMGVGDCTDLDVYSFSAVDNFDFENGRLNVPRMQELQRKINTAISNGDYNGCNTCCYTLLEGLFKCYCKYYNIDVSKDEICNLAGDVKADIIKRHPNAKFVDYSVGDFTKIIAKLADRVKKSRDNSSDSHYSEMSDKVTSLFLRDLVFSVCNFISNVVEISEVRDFKKE